MTLRPTSLHSEILRRRKSLKSNYEGAHIVNDISTSDNSVKENNSAIFGFDKNDLKTQFENGSETDDYLNLKSDKNKDKLLEHDVLSMNSEKTNNFKDNESMVFKGNSETSSMKEEYFILEESASLQDSFLFHRDQPNIPRSRSGLSLQSRGKSKNRLNKTSKSQVNLDASILSEAIKEEGTTHNINTSSEQPTESETLSITDQKETALIVDSQISEQPVSEYDTVLPASAHDININENTLKTETENQSYIHKPESTKLPEVETANQISRIPVSLSGSKVNLSSSRRDTESAQIINSTTQLDSQIENQSLGEDRHCFENKETLLANKHVTFSKPLEDNLRGSEVSINNRTISGRRMKVLRSKIADESLSTMSPRDDPDKFDEEYCNVVVYEDASSFDTLLEHINKVMEEIQRQRSEFKAELHGITRSLEDKHMCSCEGSVRGSTSGKRSTQFAFGSRTQTPNRNVSTPSHRTNYRSHYNKMSEQEAAKEEVKEEVEIKEEAKKDEKKEEVASSDKSEDKSEDKENKENKENQGTGSATPEGTLSPEPSASNGEAPGTPSKLPSLREQFRAFSKFGDIKSDGKLLTLSQCDKWFKQAKVIDGKKGSVTTTDTSICFSKLKAKKITIAEFDKYLADIAKTKSMEVKDIKDKLRGCGAPGTTGTTNVAKSSAVDRLTDTKKYTGSHKLRFDKEGKGKGAVGRTEVGDKSGYVSGYKNKNTYDKSH
ncbi:unnamed protein product [Meganyctiphanes norvegica]|uniref:TPPP family protein n=1 Tax=Meganyctiphanes norvegica TaxID=48144 RepID=A0AAV2PK42_MEGNR